MAYYQRWRLDYVEGASDRPQVFCVLTKDEGEGSLGVHSDKKYQPVYFMDDSQTWFLKQSNEGYVIGQISQADDHEYTWYLGNTDEPIMINVQGIVEPQSWQFVAAE
ncbi:hypothetical protein DEU56DRAFT_982688 [Suillus clintonianus]|uniref:uncharacterized protein n=1 Tax=Suillus clintonianus TaxID=1904413 RepID=UPI001B88134E|nr:uncharacterized protein DEU56DRAFT_982688 [Suillus clintonianus]KAG2127698.1 hypothetical protein DEU56DRAFT_982688 [Suillus clintonianus]